MGNGLSPWREGTWRAVRWFFRLEVRERGEEGNHHHHQIPVKHLDRLRLKAAPHHISSTANKSPTGTGGLFVISPKQGHTCKTAYGRKLEYKPKSQLILCSRDHMNPDQIESHDMMTSSPKNSHFLFMPGVSKTVPLRKVPKLFKFPTHPKLLLLLVIRAPRRKA